MKGENLQAGRSGDEFFILVVMETKADEKFTGRETCLLLLKCEVLHVCSFVDFCLCLISP